ncbi:ADP-ribosylglycohydrolase family protein [Helcococcus kunzii]|uniref:ADP-ribosylglycohydrolase family protein n=1 Tax=Helcococcus kunzii TaxID=40091 RepID=UPI0038B0E525
MTINTNTKPSNPILLDKIKGALYAFAIGDAMGVAAEFMTSEEIKAAYGTITDIIGGGWVSLNQGEVTDDTEMSICVMNALMMEDDEIFKKNTANEFAKWYKTNPPHIGNQCRKAISHYIDSGKYIYEDGTALGNGSLMRALPCALMDEDKYVKMNVIQGEITHFNDACREIIEEYTTIIRKYLNNEEVELKQTKLKKPTGYIYNTYNNVLYWANKPSIEGCITGAVNHGGDADTIAAIAGGMVGARLGFNSIPTRWVAQLSKEVKLELDKFIEFVMEKK